MKQYMWWFIGGAVAGYLLSGTIGGLIGVAAPANGVSG